MEEGFNPASLSFNYLPFSGVIPNEQVLYVPGYEMRNPSVAEKPDWINISFGNPYLDEEEEIYILPFYVSINPTFANNLALGYHSGNFRLRVELDTPLGWVYVVDPRPLPITLRILQYIPLSITPAGFMLSHVMGDPNPPARYLQISTSSSWSITPDQNWITFSQYNGTGSATVAVFVETGTLVLGLNMASFLVDDGRTQVIGTLSVLVTGTSTNDYTIVNPIALEFSETYGQNPTDVRTFTIDSTLECDIEVDVPWLGLSASSAPAGLTTISVSTQDTQAIAVGTYPGTITVTTTEGEFFVDVLLVIVQKQFPDIKTNGFYFADDRNRLINTSPAANQELLLNIKAQGPGFGVKNYLRKIPYYRNIASVVVGLETAILLQKAVLPPLATVFYKAIEPVRYDFRFHSRPMIGSAPAPKFTNIENTHFINGTTPPASLETEISGNILTYIPAKIAVPADAFLAFSVRSTAGIFTCKIVKIKPTQDLPPVNLPVSVSDTEIYSAILSVAQLNLVPGDRAIITFGFFTFEISIKPAQLPTTQIIWENEWDLPEIFNCTGPVKIVQGEDTDTVITARDGKDYEQVISSKEPKEFTINTGNIYSVAEREFLATILKAKRIWVQIGASRTEVVNSTRNVEVFKTRDFVPEFDLKFKSAVV